MFPVHKVLYNDGEFSIAWGTWRQSGKNGLGMRWDNLPTEFGYPTGFDKCRSVKLPRWLVIPEDLSLPIVSGLLGRAHADKGALLQVLQELLTAPATTSETT